MDDRGIPKIIPKMITLCPLVKIALPMSIFSLLFSYLRRTDSILKSGKRAGMCVPITYLDHKRLCKGINSLQHPRTEREEVLSKSQ